MTHKHFILAIVAITLAISAGTLGARDVDGGGATVEVTKQATNWRWEGA